HKFMSTETNFLLGGNQIIRVNLLLALPALNSPIESLGPSEYLFSLGTVRAASEPMRSSR
ncbi:MAG: hypothetical protein ACRCZF_01950, partial [Gemmataceae bacterium]